MKLSIVSASGNILSAPRFDRITLMTESGEITILPGHEPLISAIRPGILTADYYIGNQLHKGQYATGGGALHVSPEGVTIIADVVEDADTLTDLEYIESQKKEAEKMMKDFREEHGAAVDPKRLMEIEYDFLKYTAMHELGQRIKNPAVGGRK